MADPSPTTYEKLFLAGIGTFHPDSLKTPRVVWLQRYLDVMPLCVEWGKVDRVQVKAEAERLLRLEQQKASREAKGTDGTHPAKVLQSGP